MKSLNGVVIAILTLLSLNFVPYGADAYAQEKTIVIAGDLEKKGGYLVEITDKAFRRAGYNPQFAFVPWVRALSGAIEAEYDVLLAAYHTDDREEVLMYSDPIGTAEVVLLKLKTRDIHINKIQDMRPYKIGHIKGSKVNKEFDEAEKTFLMMDYVRDAKYNMKKLLAGRVDLVVEKRERIERLLKTTFRDSADSFEFIDPPLQRNFFYNCVSKKHKNGYQIMHDFNSGLRMIKEDGTLGAILERHNASSK